MKGVFTMLALIVLAVAAFFAGDLALDRVERAQALECARASDGTDQAIADCFTGHGQPVPEDL